MRWVAVVAVLTSMSVYAYDGAATSVNVEIQKKLQTVECTSNEIIWIWYFRLGKWYSWTANTSYITLNAYSA